MMPTTRWLIVGLGNPGAQYEETRHNVGFAVLQALAKQHNISGKSDSKFKSIVGMGSIEGTPVILAQPTTYMNCSGEAVGPLMQYYKVSPQQLLVVYDEAALPFGRIRIRPSGSAGGHNGMKSIIQALGGVDKFPRLRVGIGSPPPQIPLERYVLARFSVEEQSKIPNLLPSISQAIGQILTQGVESTMNDYNGKELILNS